MGKRSEKEIRELPSESPKFVRHARELIGKNSLIDESAPVVPGEETFSAANARGQRASGRLVINHVYGHQSSDSVSVFRRGNIFIMRSRLPLERCDHYVYTNSFSYRGRLSGLAILLMLEPAVVLPGEYDEEVWKHFDHIFGVFDALAVMGDKYHKIFFPRSDLNKVEEGDPKILYPLEGRRNAVCMISGNKHSHVDGELYSKRIEVARWFNENSAMPFDVYGRPPFTLPNYMGVIPDGQKLATLARYRFSLCFENTNHPRLSAGYVTEKILDCLEARTIPIYLGACDIKDYIPEDCFIDYRKFESPEELYRYLQNMSTEEYGGIIAAIDSWIAGGGLKKYSIQPFYDSVAAICATASGESPEELFNGENRWAEADPTPLSAKGWLFIDAPEMWTWQELSDAAAPIVANGKVIGGRIKTMTQQVTPGLTSVILIAGHENKTTLECSKTLLAGHEDNTEVIVIPADNNASAKGLANALAKLSGMARIMPDVSETGFSVNVNSAVGAANGEYIVLMSDDISLTADSLSEMRKCLDSEAASGAVMPVIVRSGGEPPLVDRTGFRDCRFITDKITGPCLLMKRFVMAEAGPLRDDICNMRASLEEYCFRLRMKGRLNMIATAAAAISGMKADYYCPVVTGNSVYEKYGGYYNQGPDAPHYFVLKALDRAAYFVGINEVEKAIEILIEGIKISPKDERLYLGMTNILIEAKRYEAAEEALSRMPGPESALHLTMAGQIKDGLGMVGESLALAERALALQKDFAPALNLKGSACYRQGNKEEARACFKAAMAADVYYGGAYTSSGLLELEEGHALDALELLERGFLLSPLSADATDAYYLAAAQTNEIDRFAGTLGDVVFYMPEVRKLTFLLIQCLLQLEKFTDAMKIIEQAVCLFEVDEGIISAGMAVREKTGTARRIPPKGYPSISACMIIKNEESNLPRCLFYAKDLFDEIVIIDTGSADKSRDIAALFGARLFEFSWNGDFSAARNESLSKASGKWIFVLDADEIIAREDFAALRDLTTKGAVNAFSFASRNYVNRSNVEGWVRNDGSYAEEAGMGWLPSYKVRLFPNRRDIRFENPVHELVENSLRQARIRIRDSNVPVHHYGKLDDEKSLVKGLEYYELGKAKLAEKGDDVMSLLELALQAAELKKYDEAMDLWHRLLKLEPNFAKAYFNLGFLCLKLGRYVEGINYSKKAIELAPGLREALLNYASCELHGGDINKAIEAVSRIVQTDPLHPSANAFLAMACFAAGSLKLANECMERIKKMNADCIGIIINHAMDLHRAGRTQLAVSLIENAGAAGYSNAKTAGLLKELKGL